MILKDIVQPIYSYLNIRGYDDSSLYFIDVADAIFDSVELLKRQEILQGRASDFSITETVYATVKSLSYPFANQASLSNEIFSGVDPSLAVISGYALSVKNKIKKSASKGDLGVFKNVTYRCVDSYENVDRAYELIFEPRNKRSFNINNSLKYKKNDALVINGSYYKLNEDVTNSGFDDVADFLATVDNTQVYWMKIENSYDPCYFYDLDKINELRLFDEYSGAYGFCVKGAKVYTSPNISTFTISYVPNIEPEYDLEADLYMPDHLKKQLIQSAIEQLNLKLTSVDNE